MGWLGSAKWRQVSLLFEAGIAAAQPSVTTQPVWGNHGWADEFFLGFHAKTFPAFGAPPGGGFPGLWDPDFGRPSWKWVLKWSF